MNGYLHLATERNSKTKLSFWKSVNLEGLALKQHVLGLAKQAPQLAETATRKERAQRCNARAASVPHARPSAYTKPCRITSHWHHRRLNRTSALLHL